MQETTLIAAWSRCSKTSTSAEHDPSGDGGDMDTISVARSRIQGIRASTYTTERWTTGLSSAAPEGLDLRS